MEMIFEGSCDRHWREDGSNGFWEFSFAPQE